MKGAEMPREQSCPRCLGLEPEDAEYCGSCGWELKRHQMAYCPHCGGNLSQHLEESPRGRPDFCSRCGGRLGPDFWELVLCWPIIRDRTLKTVFVKEPKPEPEPEPEPEQAKEPQEQL